MNLNKYLMLMILILSAQGTGYIQNIPLMIAYIISISLGIYFGGIRFNK